MELIFKCSNPKMVARPGQLYPARRAPLLDFAKKKVGTTLAVCLHWHASKIILKGARGSRTPDLEMAHCSPSLYH